MVVVYQFSVIPGTLRDDPNNHQHRGVIVYGEPYPRFNIKVALYRTVFRAGHASPLNLSFTQGQ
jgi:hypothetical protein